MGSNIQRLSIPMIQGQLPLAGSTHSLSRSIFGEMAIEYALPTEGKPGFSERCACLVCHKRAQELAIQINTHGIIPSNSSRILLVDWQSGL